MSDVTSSNNAELASARGQVQVLFVCLGNICRSPTAHGVFESVVNNQGLSEHIAVDSAGTGDWHIGHEPDTRAQHAAKKRGYELDHLRARLVTPQDFQHFHYVLAMDHANLNDLRELCPPNYDGVLDLFLNYSSEHQHLLEVPDPYAGGADGFEQVMDMVEDAAQGLLEHICAAHKLSAAPSRS